jgi:cyclopropane-fatty-acyl-phospholipid synthase
MITQEQRPGATLVPVPRPRTASRRADRAARAAALAVLRRLGRGELTLVDGTRRLRFGTATAEFPLRATVTVHDPAFYRALLSGGSRAVGLAYVDGAWDGDDLVTLTRIAAANLGRIDDVQSRLAPLLTPLQRGLRWFDRNTRARSVQQIRRHYDLGNDFYALMLDPTMTYSCGLHGHDEATLHEAQLAKLDRACRWLRLAPDDHVVEIGTGWGGFAVHAAQNYGCRVTTTTLSREQHDRAAQRVAAAGLQGRVSVVMQDYRDLRGRWDKLACIEMIEAVGAQYLRGFFAACSRLLVPDGLMFLQAITTRHTLFRSGRYGRGFADDIIFPGSCIPSVTAMLDCIGNATDMRLLSLDDITPSYPRTLLAWLDNVERNRERITAMGFDDRFLRMWRLYLAYCAGAFMERRVGDVQMLLAKPEFRGERVRAD